MVRRHGALDSLIKFGMADFIKCFTCIKNKYCTVTLLKLNSILRYF